MVELKPSNRTISKKKASLVSHGDGQKHRQQHDRDAEKGLQDPTMLAVIAAESARPTTSDSATTNATSAMFLPFEGLDCRAVFR